METKQQKTKDAGLAALLNESRELREELNDYLVSEGQTYKLSEWITFTEYAKRYELSTPNIITNWISRGIIPAEDVRLFPYLNNLRLVRSKPYKENK